MTEGQFFLLRKGFHRPFLQLGMDKIGLIPSTPNLSTLVDLVRNPPEISGMGQIPAPPFWQCQDFESV